MSNIFNFKQFSVDQIDCGMKVNTDATLIGALAESDNPKYILDIGTGTGVIAMMLAQKYPEAIIDAVEIDEKAALTAGKNFADSVFADRINIQISSFEDHFRSILAKKYDLIVSNPPYFINSSKSDDASKVLARHTNVDFFENIISGSSKHLTDQGLLYLILPLDTADLVLRTINQTQKLSLAKKIFIHSFPQSKPYRCILVLSLRAISSDNEQFTIYGSQNIYSTQYRSLLKDYLTIF